MTSEFERTNPYADELKRTAVSLGAQYIRNPAYNADRGPVKVVSVRLHTDF